MRPSRRQDGGRGLRERFSFIMASGVTMRALLEAGVHFGHQTRRWNPKMKPYIFQERNGIYIIDLSKTLAMLNDVFDAVKEMSRQGRVVLFVGTKKQAQDVVREEAERAGTFFVNQRLARRHAHQLRDDPKAHLALARARRDAPARHLRSASEKRGRAADR